MTKRFCPAIENIAEYYEIKNGYTNSTERISFSIEIVKCNRELGEECHDDQYVEKVLSYMYFTVYYLEE